MLSDMLQYWPIFTWVASLTFALIYWGARLETRVNAQKDLSDQRLTSLVETLKYYATSERLASVEEATSGVAAQLIDIKALQAKIDTKMDNLTIAVAGAAAAAATAASATTTLVQAQARERARDWHAS